MKVHYSSQSNEWATPQYLFDDFDRLHKFTLDPCATHENHKCEKYFTIEDDGLTQDWGGHTVFMNPPYGRGIKHWIKKAYEESLKPNTKVVCLIPGRTDTTYWHDYIFPHASEILFVRGRIKFGDGKSPAPFPSAIVTFGKEDEFIGTYEYREVEGCYTQQ
ncbi:DNA N-6-adenine-methyltransferase [Macrococcus animalis]|uniref:DNA N-6-adenine-methyltransferase n=1 Tax=Macrococcus animalis TaxID=3395467 RepID=UPI0039BDB61D